MKTPKTALWVSCLLLVAVLTVFGRTAWYGFVNYDDDEYVGSNAHVTGGLSGQDVAWAFTHFYASNWHPLTWLSHMLDCQLYGLDAGGPPPDQRLAARRRGHALVSGPAANDRPPLAQRLVAALFAIHPLHVESVAWVAERKDVLSGLFFMLTLLALCRLCPAAPSLGAISVLARLHPGPDGQADAGDRSGGAIAAGLLAAGKTGGLAAVLHGKNSPLRFGGGVLRGDRPGDKGDDRQCREVAVAVPGGQRFGEPGCLPGKILLSDESGRLLSPSPSQLGAGGGGWGLRVAGYSDRHRRSLETKISLPDRGLAMVSGHVDARDRPDASRLPGHGRSLYLPAADRPSHHAGLAVGSPGEPPAGRPRGRSRGLRLRRLSS